MKIFKKIIGGIFGIAFGAFAATQVIYWLNLDNKEQFASPHLRSYGNFNGGTVLLTTLQSEDKNIQTVADSSFDWKLDHRGGDSNGSRRFQKLHR